MLTSEKKILLLGLLVSLTVALGACAFGVTPREREVVPPVVNESAAAPQAQALTRDDNDGPARTISVTGVGSATTAPDIATIQLGVETRSDAPSVAAEENAAKMNNVMAAIQELGIPDKDIQTTDYSISIEPVYKDGKRTDETVYRVSNKVRVTVRDLDQVSTLLGEVVEADVNSIGGINFGVSDPEALQREARDEAMANAQAKAQQLADGLGVTLGPPQQISEWSGGTPVTPRVDAMMERAAAAPPISTGELEVSIQVSVAFAIE